MIIRVAGVGRAGYLLRTAVSATAAAGAFALLPLMAVKYRLGLAPGVAAGLIGAVAPINFWAQTSGYFDAPYTMLGLVGLCLVLSDYWVRGSFPIRGGISVGLVSGAICLLNPTILQVLAGWWVLGRVHFAGKRRIFFRFMATVAVMIVICLSPWAFRNYKALGAAVWTRSDFGLELQVSNNDHATGDLEENVRSPLFSHPHTQVTEREKVRQMGELAYQQAEKAEALSWIGNHPKRFSRLVMDRIVLFWFPSMRRWWQSLAEALISVFAIGGLVILFRRGHPSSWMFLAVLLCYPAVYSIIQVSPRYRLPIEPILLLLTCVFGLNFSGLLQGDLTSKGAKMPPQESIV